MLGIHSILLSLALMGAVPPEINPTVDGSTPTAACVIDAASGDSLSPIDRVILRGVLEALLVREGRSMSAPCQEPWRAHHTNQAGGVLVSLSARGREVKAFGDGLGSISAIYERLVAALIAGDDVPEPQLPTVVPSATVPPGAVPPGTVATQEAFWVPSGARMLPPRQRAPWQLYFNLGLGGAPAVFDDFSTAGSVGYRYMVDHWGFDISGQVLTVNADNSDDFSGEFLGTLLTTSVLRARGAYLVSPSAKSSFFCLAGLGWGEAEGEFPDTFFETHRGEGFELYASVGYEVSRKKSLHYLFELGVTVPMYELQSEFMGSSVEIGPLITLTAGLGWSPTIYNPVLP